MGFSALKAIKVKCKKIKLANDLNEKHLHCLVQDLVKILCRIKAYPIIPF